MLFRSLGQDLPKEDAPSVRELRLTGVLLRRELPLPAGAFPDADEGLRLSAAETGLVPGRFRSACDGWEFLSPEDARPLSPEVLEALLALPPERTGGPKLVTGWDCCFAALLEDGRAPEVGSRCRLRFEGAEADCEALLLEAASDARGRTALLFRLTEGAEALDGERFVNAALAG